MTWRRIARRPGGGGFVDWSFQSVRSGSTESFPRTTEAGKPRRELPSNRTRILPRVHSQRLHGLKHPRMDLVKGRIAPRLLGECLLTSAPHCYRSRTQSRATSAEASQQG
jgi:hypothetical protein